MILTEYLFFRLNASESLQFSHRLLSKDIVHHRLFSFNTTDSNSSDQTKTISIGFSHRYVYVFTSLRKICTPPPTLPHTLYDLWSRSSLCCRDSNPGYDNIVVECICVPFTNVTLLYNTTEY